MFYMQFEHNLQLFVAVNSSKTFLSCYILSLNRYFLFFFLRDGDMYLEADIASWRDWSAN